MRYEPIDSQFFIRNRERLRSLLKPNSIVILRANDILPTNADGTMAFKQNTDLFYLTGVDQEDTVLVMMPDAVDPKDRELLFVNETSELIAIWEGDKLTKEAARASSGVERVEWSASFDSLLHRLVPQADHIYLLTNEHLRASVAVETANARFIKECQRRYPLHRYERLAQAMNRLRITKDPLEIELLQKACDITEAGFRRVLGFIKPGACVLLYVENDKICRDGELVLMDVAAEYAGWNSDLTRTVPVNGRFTPRQRQVYDAVLRVVRGSNEVLRPGIRPLEYQQLTVELMERELIGLGLIDAEAARAQGPDKPLLKKYFMHSTSHHLGLDVHDVFPPHEVFAEGMVFTIEPGIYIREEGLAVRLENDVLIGKDSNFDLMGNIPIEADEIEALMASQQG